MAVLNTIVYLIITASFFIIPITLIIGLITYIVAPKEPIDQNLKMKKIGKWIALIPLLVVICIIVLWGLVNVVLSTF